MNDTNQEPHQDRLGSFGHALGARALTGLDQEEWIATEESVVMAPAEFTYRWEEEFARLLDQLDVSWQYKPRTFAVEWDEDGNFVDSFTPDFYLPVLALYVELVPLDDRNRVTKGRKVRLLRQQQQGIRVALLRVAHFLTCSSPSLILEELVLVAGAPVGHASPVAPGRSLP